MPTTLHDRLRGLRTAQRRVQPDEAWVRATRETLLMQVRNSLPPEPTRATVTVSQIFRHFAPVKFLQWLRGPVVATMSVLILALGGSVASVSAAERSLPGDFLYSLKLATEQARLAFTSLKEDKLKLKLEFTTRRGEDLKQVAKTEGPSKQGRVAQAAEILKRDLKTVTEQLDDVKSTTPTDKVVEVAKLVDQTSNELVQSLQESKSALPNDAKSKVTEAQAAAADTGVKAIEVLVEQHQKESNAIPENEVVQAIESHTKTVANVTGVAASSTLETATGTDPLTLEQAVKQIKAATQQAFAAQKTAEENVAVGSASTTAAVPTSNGSASSTTATTSTTSEPTIPAASSTPSNSMSTSTTTPP